MEEGKNIPLLVMLSAGSVISVACIIYDFDLLRTLILVLSTLVVFYLIGLIIKKIVLKINHEAEERAALLKQQEEEVKKKEAAESEEVETKNVTAG